MRQLLAPWFAETERVIYRSAKWVFASLILSLLIIGNIGALLFVIKTLREIVEQ